MKVHHIAITVNNLEESLNFYTNILGFKTVKSFERKDMGAKTTFVELNDFQIELWQFNDMITNSEPLDNIKVRGIRHIAFEVTNLKDKIKELQKKGLKFSEIKMGANSHYYSFTSDPNEVALEFYQK